jgi:uncharacterized protein (DUF2235 family)
MTQRLVICCDGTWNKPDQTRAGKLCPTNVTKLALAVAERDSAGTPQRLHYGSGVGTRRGERLRGGAFGVGLSREVRGAYRFIVDNYEPGDEIFLFGFSRGALTARSTAGLIRNAGVLRREHADRLDEAYALYRDRSNKPRSVESELFRRSYSYESPSFQTRIRFIGVWDTVGALGIPWSGVPLANWINRRWSFHDTRLSKQVDGAFQALAIDEKRKPFEPAVWVQDPEAVDQRIEQVWFAGVHCDVGGGYSDAALADVSLAWMAAHAQDYGLALREDAFTVAGGWGTAGSHLPAVGPDALGPIHESRNGMYKLIKPFVRPIGQTDPQHEYLASSAIRRHKQLDYAPPGLLAHLSGPHQVADVPDQAEIDRV